MVRGVLTDSKARHHPSTACRRDLSPHEGKRIGTGGLDRRKARPSRTAELASVITTPAFGWFYITGERYHHADLSEMLDPCAS